MLPELVRLNLREYAAAYLLASIAYLLMLFEESQLASRAGMSVDVFSLVLVQESVMAVLVLAMALAGTLKSWRYLFVVAATVFGGYAGLGMVTRFNASLELVTPLENLGVPISDYQGIFYVLALTAAIFYLATILLLRKSYGKLISNHGVNVEQQTASLTS
jgi:hypothetical protein